MIGCYDFCGHYEWTFCWVEQRGGKALLREFWDEAIHRDSQRHASALILEKSIEGMKEYWGHALSQEGVNKPPPIVLLQPCMHDAKKCRQC